MPMNRMHCSDPLSVSRGAIVRRPPFADVELVARRSTRALPGGASKDPFFDARIWGAPTIGPKTIINAPFGWIGIVRHSARMCARLLNDTEMRILVLELSASSGISIEVAPHGTEGIAALHSLASEVGQAAACIDAETGLLSRSSLQGFIGLWTAPRMQIPAMEHMELSRQVDALSESARRSLMDDAEILRSGGSFSGVNAPLLKDWNLGFPPGATTVEIVGETVIGSSRRLIAESVVAMDRLRRFVRTTERLYRLRPDELEQGYERR
jgi:hypothetical protein